MFSRKSNQLILATLVVTFVASGIATVSYAQGLHQGNERGELSNRSVSSNDIRRDMAEKRNQERAARIDRYIAKLATTGSFSEEELEQKRSNLTKRLHNKDRQQTVANLANKRATEIREEVREEVAERNAVKNVDTQYMVIPKTDRQSSQEAFRVALDMALLRNDKITLPESLRVMAVAAGGESFANSLIGLRLKDIKGKNGLIDFDAQPSSIQKQTISLAKKEKEESNKRHAVAKVKTAAKRVALQSDIQSSVSTIVAARKGSTLRDFDKERQDINAAGKATIARIRTDFSGMANIQSIIKESMEPFNKLLLENSEAKAAALK